MTEKRFTRSKSLDGDCTIYDELNDFQFPSLPPGVSEIFCVKFNELSDENKQLKEDNEFAGLLANHRGEMVSFANALIQDLDDEKIKDMWEKFKDEMYKEWKQKRGIE